MWQKSPPRNATGSHSAVYSNKNQRVAEETQHKKIASHGRNEQKLF